VAFCIALYCWAADKPAPLQPATPELCATLTARLPKVSQRDCLNTKLQQSGALSSKGFPLLTRDMAADAKRKSL